MAAAALLTPGLWLAACASDEAPGRREGGESRGPPPARPSLFVSPAGEPFRAGPGEPYPVAVWFKAADADGDGKLTREEFVADAARFFQTLDANHDGVIDGLELKAYETMVVPEITQERPVQPARAQTAGGSTFGGQGGGRGRRRGGGGGGGGGQGGPGQGGFGGGGVPQAEGAAPYGLLGEREPVADADLDINSRITLANFKTKAAQRFTTLDMDGKGYLRLEELPKTQAQQGGRRGRRQRPPGGG
jgi:Ca2+-binding EF-hand superfamily protein